MQEVLHIPAGSADPDEVGHPVVEWPWPGRQRPERVWTLLAPEAPRLPIVPKHQHNAFLEGYMHDWDLVGGAFHYYSRLSGGGVWLLLEW
jgi:hypothetical protein